MNFDSSTGYKVSLSKLFNQPVYTAIFGLGYLSTSVLLKNEEKHIDILERKTIRTKRET